MLIVFLGPAVMASYMAAVVLVEKEHPTSVVALLHVAGCGVLPITRHPRLTSMARTDQRSTACYYAACTASAGVRWRYSQAGGDRITSMSLSADVATVRAALALTEVEEKTYRDRLTRFGKIPSFSFCAGHIHLGRCSLNLVSASGVTTLSEAWDNHAR